MTIQEVQEHLKKLKVQLAEAMRQFEFKTGLHLGDKIWIERSPGSICCDTQRISHVVLSVELRS